MRGSASRGQGRVEQVAASRDRLAGQRQLQLHRTEEHDVDETKVAELRIRRQQRLGDPDFQGMTAVMTEGVIRTVVGGSEVMREQLNHLLEVSRSLPVSVHVLPFAVTPPGSDNLVIFEFPHELDNEVVYVDSDTAKCIHEEREPVRKCTYTFHAALAQALNPTASQDLIRSVMKEL
ncbi:Scr1 family TA system antitoxin-like transcriptional regulator [Haloechinothrix sp. LS1_15]|uniref:Scr1 family TA system antitoxin-like transcriptional regulator n=1 Tax=Haloechinothrix sp. LS1_15 TaxID=2652248 RepID=UPI0029467CAC|nr:Scr1 family TA system antitoxin-like transcriptional regulator [Haloechinothrix sp. LS1_15]MDV6014752.1 hypothetical protein [Haloechinothrix sp. LS1_15]